MSKAVNMSEYTLRLLRMFREITGVYPTSARRGTGSMRPYVRFKMPYTDEIKDFASWENYYRDEKTNFKGVNIKYLGNSFDLDWHKKHGYEFEVEIEHLLSLNQKEKQDD